MRACGIIAEYNPFHNGHKYHIDQTRKLLNAPVVAVMSGNFVQRGEPAIIDKFTRAKCAATNGIDLVLELPVVFAVSSAEHFAAGAIQLLSSLGIIDDICCGAENELILDSEQAVRSIDSERLKTAMKSGISYATAAAKIAPLPNKITPNNILALEYQRAITKYACKIKLHTIKRIDNNYNDTLLAKGISSATALRQELNKTNGDISKIITQIPATCTAEAEEYFKNHSLCRLEDYWQIIAHKLRTLSSSELVQRLDWKEGLENRFLKSAFISNSISELLAKIKSKRYTYTRLQRLLIHLLLNIDRNDLDLFRTLGPQYIRPLAWNATGEKLLKHIAKNSQLPIITSIAKFHKNNAHTTAAKMLDYDVMATKIHSIVSRVDPIGDFHNPPIIV